MKKFVYGDYVISECENAFNDKHSYWISKKGCTLSVYCFTPIDDKDLAFQLENARGYIWMFDSKLKDIEYALN